MKPHKSPLFALRAAIISGLVIACFTLGYWLKEAINSPKTIAGQEVIFSNTYLTSQRVVVEGDNVYFTGCMEEQIRLDLTLDTLVLSTPKGALGFKPQYANEKNELICHAKDGVEVKFIRFYPKGLEEIPSNEVLLYITPYGSVALNANNKCIDPNQIPAK